MSWWGYLIIAVVLALVYPVTRYFYKVGLKKGADDLLKLFLVNGYDQKVKAFREQNKTSLKKGIVFVGDSITQDFPVQDYFPGKIVYNRGIGGDTTVGLLKRLNESVFDLEPSLMVLQMGTNDFGVLNAEPEEVNKRMVEAIAKIKEHSPKLKIVLLSVYPVNQKIDKFSVASRNNQAICKLNELYKQIQGVTYVNLYDKLLDDQGDLNRNYTVEGLHINQNGYRIISDELINVFKSLEAKTK